MIKQFFFTSHIIGILLVNFGWLYTYYVLFLHPFVILSWYINNNKCLISQIEYYLFNSTFLGNGEKYHVPKKYRIVLYINFICGLLYYKYLDIYI